MKDLHEVDFENIRPQYDVDKMDKNLLGNNFEEHPGPFTPLEKARVLAQVSGPNFQEGVAQAIQGDETDIDHYKVFLEKDFGGNKYNLLRWVAYYVGHGDPNCANYHNWAGLLVEANYSAFLAAKKPLEKLFATYNQALSQIHPELQKILVNDYYRVHFTSMRIPKVEYDSIKQQLLVDWPGNDMDKIVGEPPKIIDLS